jgi:protein-arginine kinase activator protein McsA
VRTVTTEFNGKMVTVTLHEHTCKVCGETYEDTLDEQFWCTDCDNEFAEWLDEMGYVVGEFDTYDHPNFKPDALKGTKWERMNS